MNVKITEKDSRCFTRLRVNVFLFAMMAVCSPFVAFAEKMYSLVIDRNTFFNDGVTVLSEVAPDEAGKYPAGTKVRLVAVPDETGTFRKWYGDVPREDCTKPEVTIVISADTWIYARFVHAWTLSSDKTTMTDGNFTVNVTDVNESTHTLTVGKPQDAGLLSENSSVQQPSVIDLGGTILLEGDPQPWTITKFAAYRGSQSVTNSIATKFSGYISPGTIQTNNEKQLFHCGAKKGDSTRYGAEYTILIIDEPSITALTSSHFMRHREDVERLILDIPHVTELKGEINVILELTQLSKTKFTWWDLSSLSQVAPGFFANGWGSEYYLRPRVNSGGVLSLPSLRSTEWTANGTQFNLMWNVTEISLGGATEATTVTQLCSRAFAGDSSLTKLTLHADPNIKIGTGLFADQWYNTSVAETVEIEGMVCNKGTRTSTGSVPGVIHFTGQAISGEAIANLLGDVPVVETAEKPVVIHASRFQRGWGGDGVWADWISAATEAEKAAYPNERVIGVYRQDAAAPCGKAMIVHRGNEWDKLPGLMVVVQ